MERPGHQRRRQVDGGEDDALVLELADLVGLVSPGPAVHRLVEHRRDGRARVQRQIASDLVRRRRDPRTLKQRGGLHRTGREHDPPCPNGHRMACHARAHTPTARLPFISTRSTRHPVQTVAPNDIARGR